MLLTLVTRTQQCLLCFDLVDFVGFVKMSEIGRSALDLSVRPT